METNQQKLTAAEQQARNFKTGEFWATIGVLTNLFLCAFKYFAGFVGHSAAMISDATHSASDMVSSAVVFFSMKMAKRPADKKHPYGHGGAEVVSTMMVGLILFAAGSYIIVSALEKILSGEPIEMPGVIALIASIVSIVTKLILSVLTKAAGKKINSPSLIASSMDQLSDVYSSIGTLVGIGGALLGWTILDPIAGAVVALFVLQMALRIFKTAYDQIMSRSCGDEAYETIQARAMEVEGVSGIKNIRTRLSGPYLLIEVVITVDNAMTIADARAVALKVHDRVLNNVPHAYDVVVRFEPAN